MKATAARRLLAVPRLVSGRYGLLVGFDGTIRIWDAASRSKNG